MISERKLINLLNIFNTELPEFFSPYQASEHMEWDYDKTKLAKHLKTSPSTAYGLLRDMEKRGLAVVEKDGRKNIYRLPEPSRKPEPENQYVEVHEPEEVLNECQYLGVNFTPLTLGKIIDNFWQDITHAECKKNDPSPNRLTLSFKDQKSVIESYNDLPENMKNTITLKIDPYRKTYTMDIFI